MKYNKLYVFSDPNVQLFEEYLDFNDIKYTVIDCWDHDDPSFIIPDQLLLETNACLIISQTYLNDLSRVDKCKKTVTEFLQKNTLITACDTGDAFEDFHFYGTSTGTELLLCLKELDSIIPKDSLQIILDNKATDDNWLKLFNNIKCVDSPIIERCLTPMERIRGAEISKKNCKYDFLLTTVMKSHRPHRQLLKNKINYRDQLKNKGYVVFNVNRAESDHWVGDFPKNKTWHGWLDAHPSMDLYKDCWLELIPETLCNNYHYITEKTTKAIITKTPFLIVSTPGYLLFLRDMGFKTFSPYIDESYDLEQDLDKRIDMVLDSLENVTKNGAEKCFLNVQHILDHNYKKFAELCGKWHHDKDMFVKNQLQ